MIEGQSAFALTLCFALVSSDGWLKHVIRLQVLEVIIISSMRCGVSSPDETLKKRVENMTCRGVFLMNLRCFIWWTLCWMLDITSPTKWRLKKEKLRMQKWGVFHLISKHSLNNYFLCIFFINYWWVWEDPNMHDQIACFNSTHS